MSYQQPTKTTISIFGSCVSRDIFAIAKNGTKRFSIQGYIARQSIVSALAKPLHCVINQIQLTSNFQKKLIHNDISKSTFDILKESNSKYLLIDFIDERFELAEFQGSIITLSAEFIASNYANIKELAKVERGKCDDGYWINGRKLETYISEFVNQLLKIFKPENIIIHRALFTNSYLDNENCIKKFSEDKIEQHTKINDLLNYMYDNISKQLVVSKSISLADQFHASEKHKWGLAGMHFQTKYYEVVLDELNKIINTLG